MLREKPASITAQVPISRTGMATIGTSVARQVFRNNSTTSATQPGRLEDRD